MRACHLRDAFFVADGAGIIILRPPTNHLFRMRLQHTKLPFLALLALVLASVSAPAQNRVLDLDGTGDYVSLPPAGFTNFHQATIKA